MRSWHYRIEVRGRIARSCFVEIAVADEPREYVGAVGAYGRTRGDDPGGEFDHVSAAGFIGQFKPDPAEAAAVVAFDGDGDRRLVGGTSHPTGGPSAQEALVQLHHTAEQLAVGAHHGPAQFVQPSPGRLVRAETQGVFQSLRGDPVLLRGDEPDRGEPGRKRRM